MELGLPPFYASIYGRKFNWGFRRNRQKSSIILFFSPQPPVREGSCCVWDIFERGKEKGVMVFISTHFPSPPSGNIIKGTRVLFIVTVSHGVSTDPRFQWESLLSAPPAATATQKTTIDQKFFLSSGCSSRRVPAKQIHHAGISLFIDLCGFARSRTGIKNKQKTRIFSKENSTRLYFRLRNDKSQINLPPLQVNK